MANSHKEFMRLAHLANQATSEDELRKLAEKSKELVAADPSQAPLLSTLFSFLFFRLRFNELEKHVKALEVKQ